MSRLESKVKRIFTTIFLATLTLIICYSILLYRISSLLSVKDVEDLSGQGAASLMSTGRKQWKSKSDNGKTQDSQLQNVVLRERALVHKYFWKLRKKVLENKIVSADDLTPEEAADLKKFFTRGNGLWGNGRHQDRNFGGDDYDWRIVGRLLWEYVGEHLYSNDFAVKKPFVPKLDAGKCIDRNLCQRGFQTRFKLSPESTLFTTGNDNLLTKFDEDVMIREPNTTYIDAAYIESPYSVFTASLRPNDITYSHWRGSELYAPFAAWIYYDPNVRSKRQFQDFAFGKSKMAAILISHCYTVNDRMGYIKELRKHMSVDIFGDCGTQNLTCPQVRQKACLGMLKAQYRFYLAFENSNCRDYITEKLYVNAFLHDMIPVVLGAHPADYRALAPQKSYIHVEDFKDPKDLASFLISLSANRTAYNEYFEWRGTGEFVFSHELNCVCSMFWYAEVHPIPLRDRSSFWHFQGENKPGDPTCLRKDRWYWSRHKR